jgi:hypothetical protein
LAGRLLNLLLILLLCFDDVDPNKIKSVHASEG